jgi:hypothetical protein
VTSDQFEKGDDQNWSGLWADHDQTGVKSHKISLSLAYNLEWVDFCDSPTLYVSFLNNPKHFRTYL